MPAAPFRKFLFTFLLLAVWAAGSSLVARPGSGHGPAGPAYASLDCCRIAPLIRTEARSSRLLFSMVHSGSAPCNDCPLGTPCRLTSYQHPDSPLPENPGQPLLSPIERRHRLFAYCDQGFAARPGPAGHPALSLLKSVVLLN